MTDIQIDDESDGRADAAPAPDIAGHIREAVDRAFAAHHLPQRAATADLVMRGNLVGGLKVVLPVLLGLGTVLGGVISVGERVSTISQRIDKAFAAAAETQGWVRAAEPRLVALEYQSTTGAKERASLDTRIAQNRDALATQLEELRKGREASNIKLGRIEGQLDDLRSAVARLETLGRGGPISRSWDDAKKR